MPRLKRTVRRHLKTNSAKKIMRISTNDCEKLKTRFEEVDGKNYLVAPCILVKEQVLNGEYLTATAIKNSVELWEGQRVVVNHPVGKDGESENANTRDSIEEYHVGYVWNVAYDEPSKKLKGEVFLDIDKMAKNEESKAAYDKVLKSQQMECSTGYYVTTLEEKEDEYDGVPYTAIQHEIIPNHLALLPNDVGACSLEDGGGVRNNAYRHKIQIDDGNKLPFSKAMLDTFYNIFPKFKPNNYITANEQSQIMLLENILLKIQEFHSDVKAVNELYYDRRKGTDYAVFSKKDSQGKEHVYKVSYEFDRRSSEVKLGKSATEVISARQYIDKPKRKPTQRKRGNNMALFRKNSKTKKPVTTNKTQKKSTKLAAPAERRLSARAKRALEMRKNVTAEELIDMEQGAALDIIENIESVDELIAITLELDAEIGAIEEEITELETNDAATEEEISELEEEADDIEELIEECNARIEELGGEPVIEIASELSDNMDTSDLDELNPDEDDEEDTVKALENARRRRKDPATITRHSRRAPFINTQMRKEMLELKAFKKACKNVGIAENDMKLSVNNFIKGNKKYRDELIENITKTNARFSVNSLKVMDNPTLEAIAQGQGVEMPPNYSIKGMQRTNDKKQGVELSGGIYAKKKGDNN